MKKITTFLFASLLSLGLIAQSQRNISNNSLELSLQRKCGSMENLDRLIKQDPSLAIRMQEIENHTSKVISSRASMAVVNIPVVVHVIYNTTAQNISDAQIQSQLTVLNNDYRKLNADKINVPSAFSALAADAQINFCLAVRSPQGTATTGIIRKQTSVTSFTDDNVKYNSTGGSDAWPAGQYLNIWVCNLGSSLLGYAQFPGGLAATDGVVVLYKAFGTNGAAVAPFNKGRTMTHEVGHWLNLRHIWGDGACATDYVTDTPTQGAENYGCPSYPHPSCSNSSDMFMNYMDYVDDACMNMFTTGQSSRMNALFASGGSKASLLTSQGCVAVSGGTTCNLPGTLSVSAVTSSFATLNWGSTGATSYNVKYKSLSSTTWTTYTGVTTNYKSVSGLTASTSYEFQVQGVCGTTLTAYSTSKSFTTSATTSTNTAATVFIGSGTSTLIAPYGTYYMDEHSQFVITKDELIAAGYTSAKNTIQSLGFNVSSASTGVMSGFTIKLRHTTAASFTSTSFLVATNLVTVYSGNVTAVAGWNTHNFSAGFAYNGVDNLLVDICWNNSTYTSDTKVYGTSLVGYNSLYKQADNATTAVCDVTTGTRSLIRPNMKLTMGASGTSRYGFNAEASGEPIAEDNNQISIEKNGIFNIFPNPVHNELNIDFSEITDDTKVSVSIYNLLGEQVASTSSNESTQVKLSIEDEKFSSLKSGIYFCTLRYHGKSITERFVIQK